MALPVHCVLVELGFGMLVFVEGGKAENPEKDPCGNGENQQRTQPTYVVSPGLEPDVSLFLGNK